MANIVKLDVVLETIQLIASDVPNRSECADSTVDHGISSRDTNLWFDFADEVCFIRISKTKILLVGNLKYVNTVNYTE